jgi:hypothetical protein
MSQHLAATALPPKKEVIMNTKQTLSILVLALSAAVAHAGDAGQPAGAADERPLTRSEVIADLHLWQRAGMERFNVEGADITSTEYQQARAAYWRLRNSPAYQEEVRRVAAKRHEVVATTASPRTEH